MKKYLSIAIAQLIGAFLWGMVTAASLSLNMDRLDKKSIMITPAVAATMSLRELSEYRI